MPIRFSFTLDKVKTARRYGVPVKEMPQAQYNISPGKPIISITAENQSSLSFLKWGIAFENHKLKKTHYLISKSNFKTGSFKHLLLQKRCIIPADGFYFWKRVSRKSLIPYRVALKWNLPFAFAGIYNEEQDGNNNIIQNVALINIASNNLLKPFIKMSPLILPLEKEKLWLSNDLSMNEIIDIMAPYPDEKIKLFPVTSLINNPDFNSPSLLEPVNYATDQKGNYILFTD